MRGALPQDGSVKSIHNWTFIATRLAQQPDDRLPGELIPLLPVLLAPHMLGTGEERMSVTPEGRNIL